jgi:ribosomal protein L30/L7E
VCGSAITLENVILYFIWSHRLTVRTLGFHPRNRSSILRGTTAQLCYTFNSAKAKSTFGPAVQRSGRCPVTAEIEGSNPFRTALSDENTQVVKEPSTWQTVKRGNQALIFILP